MLSLTMILSDVKIVADNINDFIEVPNGIDRLRKAVITLAVSGKLVPQEKSEGAAEELYNQIQIKRVKIKKIIEIESKDKLFTIPSNWKWSRLEDIFDVRDGTHDSPKYYDTGYPLVTSKNLYYGNLDFLNVKYVSEADYKKINDRSKVDRDDILFAMIGSIGNPVIVNTDIEFSIKNVALFKYYDRNLTEPNFLLIYLKYAAERMKTISAGGVQSFVSLGFLRGYPFPLPPIAEQKRIVKKVEELMMKIDELDTKKKERDETRTRLARSAMQSLGKGDSKIAFKHLTELIKTHSDLKELEGALLTLAVSGKLVPQDTKDGVVKDSRATDEYGEEFNIPKSWQWFQLNDICTFKYGYTDSAKETGTARFVRITDMSNDGSVIPNDQRYVDLTAESEKYLLQVGDLLTARIGATFGRTILFKEEYKAVYASYLIRMSFENDFILPEYYLVFSKSGLYWSQAHLLVSGSAQPQFNANLIKKMYLPVPPLVEQKRIVKKVEEIMSLVNKLKKTIA